VIEAEERYSIVGILDAPEKVGEKICGYPIMGTDDDLPQLIKEYRNFLITVGHIQSSKTRHKLLVLLKKLKVILPVIVAPSAYVSQRSMIGQGTIVMHHAVVNAEARIGENCIINTGALIEHETEIGSDCHISTYATANGQCRIGNDCFIGSHTVLANNISIADHCLISAGSVVLKTLSEPGTYIGNPLRKIR